MKHFIVVYFYFYITSNVYKHFTINAFNLKEKQVVRKKLEYAYLLILIFNYCVHLWILFALLHKQRSSSVLSLYLCFFTPTRFLFFTYT